MVAILPVSCSQIVDILPVSGYVVFFPHSIYLFINSSVKRELLFTAYQEVNLYTIIGQSVRVYLGVETPGKIVKTGHC